MYEENTKPLPPGDVLQSFAPVFMEIQQTCKLTAPPPITHDNVLFWAKQDLQEQLSRISRRLLLPGSEIVGLERLESLVELAAGGASCILCLNHRSNLDVPTLGTMLQDQGKPELFEKIIWVAGRKLHEDKGMTGMLVQAFNRVIVTPRSWSQGEHTADEIHEGHLVNLAAHRVVHELRHQGWVFAVFPSGTRIRPRDVSTTRAIPETDSYLKSFEYMLLGNVKGCTLPVSRDQDLTRETPQLDQVSFVFGELMATEDWRNRAAARFPQLDQRAASARAIMQDIAALRS